jgi:hypothetical protein
MNSTGENLGSGLEIGFRLPICMGWRFGELAMAFADHVLLSDRVGAKNPLAFADFLCVVLLPMHFERCIPSRKE